MLGRMKRLLIFTIVFFLLLLSLVGCGERIGISFWVEFHKADNPQAKNISFIELSPFLENFRFVNIPASNACGWYALALHNGAEAQGIRTAIVVSKVGDGYHAFNAFQTTDQGVIYIDATTGKCLIAREANGAYWVEMEIENPVPQIRIQRLGPEKDFIIFR